MAVQGGGEGGVVEAGARAGVADGLYVVEERQVGDDDAFAFAFAATLFTLGRFTVFDSAMTFSPLSVIICHHTRLMTVMTTVFAVV